MYYSFQQIRVQKIITTAWDVFQPLLFGLVGLEVSVASLKSNAIGKNYYRHEKRKSWKYLRKLWIIFGFIYGMSLNATRTFFKHSHWDINIHLLFLLLCALFVSKDRPLSPSLSDLREWGLAFFSEEKY